MAVKLGNPMRMEQAIGSFELLKTPGQANSLQKEIDINLGPIAKMLRTSVAIRTSPKALRKSRIASIPKSDKNVLVGPRDFRPIRLTTFVLKTLKNHLKETTFV